MTGSDRQPARRLDPRTILTAEYEPIPYRVDRFAVDGCVTVLAAFGGEGKSILTNALAIGVSAGSAIAGIACTKGRALIIDAENGERLIARRYRALDGPAEGVALYEADHVDLTQHAEWLRQVIHDEDGKFRVDIEPPWRWFHIHQTGEYLTLDAADPPPESHGDRPTKRDDVADQASAILASSHRVSGRHSARLHLGYR